MQQDGRTFQKADGLNEELTAEELEVLAEQMAVELPDREAVSVVNGSVTLSVGSAANAGLLPVEKPPETAEWAGILDRLKRASAPQN